MVNYVVCYVLCRTVLLQQTIFSVIFCFMFFSVSFEFINSNKGIAEEGIFFRVEICSIYRVESCSIIVLKVAFPLPFFTLNYHCP